MKKGYAILLLLFYSLATFGIGLKEHYCCGKLKSVTIGFVAIEKHKCSKDNQAPGCCKSIIQNIKVKDDQVTSTEIQVPAKASIELHNVLSLWQSLFFISPQFKAAESYHSPPSSSNVPINIYNCVYRI